jgi:four helix bundle protein
MAKERKNIMLFRVGVAVINSLMANITDFRDFEAFKACRTFAREVGLLIRSVPLRSNRSLVDQMERASISVLSNFAEGFERDGNAEFAQFISISKGSVGELRAQLIYCLDIDLIGEERYETLDLMGGTAARLLGGLARYLKTSKKAGRKYIYRSNPLRKMRRRTPVKGRKGHQENKRRTSNLELEP